MINRYIKPENILPYIPWPSNRPARLSCPLCNKAALSMHVFIDPVDTGTGYYCTACSFSGNSIQLLQRLKNYGTVEVTIQDLQHNAMAYQIPKTAFTPASIDHSINTIKRRNEINKFWSECRDNYVYGGEAPWRNIAHRLHIWQTGGRECRILVSSFIGASTKEHAERFGLKVPGKGFKHFLLIPYYSAPGMLVAFYCIPEFDSSENYWMPVDGDEKRSDMGLFGLTGEGLNEQTLFVIDNPVMALQLLRDRFTRSGQPLPISSYSSGTVEAYKSVCADKTIWAINKDLCFWKNAYAAKARIAMRPNFYKTNIDETDIFNFSRTRGIQHGPSHRLRQMAESSVLWTNAIKDHLLSLDFASAMSLCSQLKFVTTDQALIRSVCSEAELIQIDSILGSTITSGVYVFNNKQYVIHHDGIYRLYNNGNEEKVSSVIVIPDVITVNPANTSERYLSGTIKGLNFMLPFLCKHDALNKKPVETLSDIVVKDNNTYPYIAPHFEKQFLPFCMSIVPSVEQVVGVNKVGWNNSEFMAPKFSIINGEIVAKQNLIISKHVPMQFMLPKGAISDSMLELWQTSPMLLAVGTVLLYYILAPKYSYKRYRLGVYGNSADLVIDSLFRELGLIRCNVTEFKEKYLAELKSIEDSHDVPLITQYTGDNLFKAWLTTPGENSIAAIKEADVGLVKTYDWLTLKAHNLGLINFRGFNEVIPCFIKWLQLNSGVMEEGITPIHCVMNTLYKFLCVTKTPEKSTVDDALALIDTSVFTSAENTCERVLSALFAMIEADHIKPPTVTSTAARADLIYNPNQNKLIIRKEAFFTGVKRLKLTTEFDASAISNSFSEHGILVGETYDSLASWIISYSYWEEKYLAWLNGKSVSNMEPINDSICTI